MFTDTYTGIDPISGPAFLVAQVNAGFAAAGVAVPFSPEPPRQKTHA